MRFICLLIASLFASQLFAQTNFRFADSTSQWNIVNITAEHNAFVYRTDTFTASTDTVIGQLNYQGINIPDFYTDWYGGKKAFVREDSIGRVFEKRTNIPDEFLIYDFSKQTGDTFTINDPFFFNRPVFCHVDNDTIIQFFGKTSRVLFVSFNRTNYLNDIWVEGIGSLLSPFLSPGIGRDCIECDLYLVLCYSAQNVTLYHNEDFPNCDTNTVITAIDPLTINTIKISPNPVTDSELTIQSEDDVGDKSSFELFDLAGRKILQKPLQEKVTWLKLPDVSKGIYLYQIISERKQITCGKLAVQ